MADLEAERLQNMQCVPHPTSCCSSYAQSLMLLPSWSNRNNAQLLASLGLQAKPSTSTPQPQSQDDSKPATSKSKRKQPSSSSSTPAFPPPERKSARLRAQPAPADRIVDDDDTATTAPGPLIRKLEPAALPEPDDLDDYDPHYRAPLPSRDADGKRCWRFEEGYEAFTPNLSPQEIFRKGVFGGSFFRNTYSKALRKPLDAKEDVDAFPGEWWDGLDHASVLTADEYDTEKNCYGVKAGQSLADWEAAGWIRHWDPRGWMQWYCNFFLGRRTPDDHRQIKRCASLFTLSQRKRERDTLS